MASMDHEKFLKMDESLRLMEAKIDFGVWRAVGALQKGKDIEEVVNQIYPGVAEVVTEQECREALLYRLQGCYCVSVKHQTEIKRLMKDRENEPSLWEYVEANNLDKGLVENFIHEEWRIDEGLDDPPDDFSEKEEAMERVCKVLGISPPPKV